MEARYAADGKHVATASTAGPVRLWDIEQRRSRLVVSEPEKPKYAVAVDATARRVAFATGGADASVVTSTVVAGWS